MISLADFQPLSPGEGTPRNIWWGCAARFPKPLPYLWPKRPKHHTLWGRIYLYSPYKGVDPAPVLSLLLKSTFFNNKRGFTDRYINVKVHANEEVSVYKLRYAVRSLRDGASFRRLASLINSTKTSVTCTDLTAFSPYSRPRSRFSHTYLLLVNKS